MKPVMDYKLLMDTDSAKLVLDIKKHLANGWQLQGGATVQMVEVKTGTVPFGMPPRFPRYEPLFVQAMVR
jgi:hypothetical protein